MAHGRGGCGGMESGRRCERSRWPGNRAGQQGQDQSLAIYKPFSGKDLEVLVRFKPVTGTVDQAGGIAVRVVTPDDYDVLRANALEDNVRFYRVVKGQREQLGGADVKVAPNVWHTLALKAKGDRFSISYDSKMLFTAEDNTFAGPGKVALWTKADSVTHFDTIVITPLD